MSISNGSKEILMSFWLIEYLMYIYNNTLHPLNFLFIQFQYFYNHILMRDDFAILPLPVLHYIAKKRFILP